MVKKLKCNIRKKECRRRKFEEIVANASNKELHNLDRTLKKEIRLSETAIREGFE